MLFVKDIETKSLSKPQSNIKIVNDMQIDTNFSINDTILLYSINLVFIVTLIYSEK